MSDFPVFENWIVDALLSLAVGAAWLACWAFLLSRRNPLGALHHPSLLAGTTGTAIVLAALMSEGLTVRVGKLLLLDGLVLVSGLVLSRALARSALRSVGPVGRRVRPVEHRE